MLKNFLLNRFVSWHEALTAYRHQAYLSLFKDNGEVLLGLGCAEGNLTCKVAEKIGAQQIIGIDRKNKLSGIYQEKLRLINFDLNNGIPLENDSVDVVSGDQIIEHLYQTDLFVEEIYRVLNPGGYAVICTENIASLHNLWALLWGKQAFSQSVSSRYKIGNPFSPHYKKPLEAGNFHVQIFTVQGLRDIFELYNFQVEEIRGIIYFPFLPFWEGKVFERLFPAHAHFIAIRARKAQ